MKEDIQAALDKITKMLPEREMFIDYYDGVHRLAFASEKFVNTFGETLKRMRENLCPIVVDAPADRMEVINFSSGENKDTSTRAWEIWQRELMELNSGEVHREAFKCRDAYLIVWGDENNEAKFYLQDSRQCALIKDENTGKVLYGAKLWKLADERIRLTLYYPERIEKWVTQNKKKEGITGQLKAAAFIPYTEADEIPETPNPYNIIPMFHFEAEPILVNAMPIQDRLNKTICDELVAQEFAGYPQRYAVGLEPPVNAITGNKEIPFKAGVDRLWFSEDSNTKFGEFQTADLEQFIKVEDAARLSMARVTGTPLHFFSFTTSDAISGEALKTLESRFTKRVKRTCLAHGAIWAQAMKLALTIEGTSIDSSLTVQWESPEQRSESEMLNNLGLKKEILEIPVDILREECGYSVEDIAKFNANPNPPQANENESDLVN
jgi:hypothetical protein